VNITVKNVAFPTGTSLTPIEPFGTNTVLVFGHKGNPIS